MQEGDLAAHKWSGEAASDPAPERIRSDRRGKSGILDNWQGHNASHTVENSFSIEALPGISVHPNWHQEFLHTLACLSCDYVGACTPRLVNVDRQCEHP